MQKPVKKTRYGTEVWETEGMDMLRRENCMCLHCGKLKPKLIDNCPIAEKFYTLCVENGTAFILTRCKDWIEKGGSK